MFKLAGYVLWPFGRTAVKSPDANAASTVGNVLWAIFLGIPLAVVHLLAALACLAGCVLLITIPILVPFAVANLKMTALAIWPFGREVVDQQTLRGIYGRSLAERPVSGPPAG